MGHNFKWRSLKKNLAPTETQSGPSATPCSKTAKQWLPKGTRNECLISLWRHHIRFGGNDKKNQKDTDENLEELSKEDINQFFLRSLPPSWSQIALIMRNKPNIDQNDIDDLYNNLKVYEDKMKSAGGTSSTSQGSSTLGADEVVCSFFAQQITSPPLVLRTRISVEDVALAAHEKPSESSLKDNDVQDSKDVADNEGQHQMAEDEQVLHDKLEKMIAQEVVAKALDDATRQAFEEEKRNVASQNRAAQATSTNKLSTVGQIPIDASTLPNVDLPTDPNMPDLEDVSIAFPNDGIFSGACDDNDVGTEANFNNIDNTIDVSPIPILRVHKDHPKEEPKNISQALQDERWVEAMQEELLQFKLQKVWVLVDLLYGKMEEGIDYDEVFTPVVRIEAIMLFLAFASYMGFTIYQMDVKSAFLYGTIEEEVYVQQPLGFVDTAHPNKVYKESQDKYVADILKKFDFCSIKTVTTPIESNKPLVKDEDGVDVDVHIYRSMIDSLMYLTTSRPDIMFVVCACARDSPFVLEAFSDSDYGGASLDRKSTTGGCQFLGRRLISWQCKKQTIVANSTTKAEYVAAANCFKNPVYHSRTKHIEIRHHFIKDCYEKRLIDFVKIHTDNNVADLLTKGFDVTRLNFLVLELILLGNSMDLRMDGSCASNFSHIWVMTTLKYSDKHNMVAFLKKPNESVGFTEIVDFLKGTSLRYALTHNPTIYDSLVKQFWQTATVRTLANGTPELVASIDNKEYTITEASVRSKLQLADAAGISNLPDAEIYDGLATLGYVSEGKLTFWKKNFTPQWKFLIHTILHCLSPKSGGWDQFGSPIATALICLSSNRVYNFSKLIFDGMVHNIESNTKFLMYPRFLQMILGITTENNGKYLAPTLTKKLFSNMKMGYAGDYVPLLPAMLAGTAEDQGEGLAIPAEPQHTPTDPDTKIPQSQGPIFTHVADEATTTGVRVGTKGATTTTSGLDAGLDSGNIHESPLRSYEAPLHEGHTSGSAGDSLQLKELMVLVPKLVTRIANLEKELHQIKTTYGKTVLTLVERVKSLEVALKRKTKKVVVSDSEDEETENQGRKIQDIDDDPLVSLVRESMKEKDTDFVTPIRISASREIQESKSIEKDISTNLDAGIEVNPGSEDFNTGNEDFNTGSLGVSTGSGPVSTPTTKRTKAQIQQEEAGLAETMRLQALQEEEAARQVHLDALLAKRISEEEELSKQQKKRKYEVQEAAQNYTEEDWDSIREKLEANAKLTKSLQGESMTNEDFAKRMVEMINQKKKFYAEQKAKARRSKPMIQAH
ncbi:putative ribonuclease H-like domain-containing protein [Tanacetum coccineum]